VFINVISSFFLCCVIVQDVFDYVGEFSYWDVCVHVRDVNLFKIVNEAYRVVYVKGIW
jgi:hypothetical protein